MTLQETLQHLPPTVRAQLQPFLDMLQLHLSPIDWERMLTFIGSMDPEQRAALMAFLARRETHAPAVGTEAPDFDLVAVASRHGEAAEQIRATAAARHLTFPILHDASGMVARQWFTQQTPRVFLLNPQLNLLYRGAIDNFKYPDDSDYQAYLEPAIDAFLAGRPIERAETASFGCAVQSVYYILPKPLARESQATVSQP